MNAVMRCLPWRVRLAVAVVAGLVLAVGFVTLEVATGSR